MKFLNILYRFSNSEKLIETGEMKWIIEAGFCELMVETYVKRTFTDYWYIPRGRKVDQETGGGANQVLWSIEKCRIQVSLDGGFGKGRRLVEMPPVTEKTRSINIWAIKREVWCPRVTDVKRSRYRQVIEHK